MLSIIGCLVRPVGDRLLVPVEHAIRSGLESNRLPSNQIPHCSNSEFGLTDSETACCFTQGLDLLVTELDCDSYRYSPPGGLMASWFAAPFAEARSPMVGSWGGLAPALSRLGNGRAITQVRGQGLGATRAEVDLVGRFS
jgi:hypothetical protein